ncbi:carboxypeptidase-like regulatory domain-containing protein [Aquimarina litoralis]|uniref:carboxypeptidase-like regulatory domain-containing protein n=1 Tax=Aquimarina litoralis TaxID=584605 RepID=UPI001C570AA0|nr:carboxypeptidase-like regulatory domain-containing protein [Aquimarina litoralis]MBW1294754.1 hypothetical protein [Aquimarina litoralis]
MKYKSLLVALIAISYSYGQEKIITIKNKFDYEEVKWFKNSGKGKIKGTAKFKSKQGEVRFGEEFRIELMPSCSYTEERLNNIYSNTSSGAVFVEDGIPKFTPDPEAYHDTKKTMCNQNGEFEYRNLPSGDYYLIAFMLWDKTGGGIMKKITINENETKTVELINF